MTAPAHARAVAFLCRAGLFAAVLALVAGILGMHVMTGNHSMHSPAAMTATTAGTIHAESDAHNHSGHPASGPNSTHQTSVQDVAGSSAEPCSGSCTTMETMAVSCTPSAKSESLSAPLAGTTVFGAVPTARVTVALPCFYSYLPGGPSPGELSISRT